MPVTRRELASGFVELGLRPDDIVIVHTSLSAFGTLVGGAITPCLALRDVLRDGGTAVMPGFTPQLCHPISWPQDRLGMGDPFRLAEEMPIFDSHNTPVAATMGAVAECFRAMRGTARSNHPHTSFLAQGPKAQSLLWSHPLEYRLSSLGPLGRLWEFDAKILLLGVPWSKCTALHLAEYGSAYPGRRCGKWRVPTDCKGTVRWSLVPELLVWEGDFDDIGQQFQAGARTFRRAHIGPADCALFSLRELMRYTSAWLPRNRDLRAYGVPPGWDEVDFADSVLPVPSLGS